MAKVQNFNSGVLKIYKVTNIGESGNRPKDRLELKFENTIPYEERTVGVTRFSLGKQDQSIIEKLLRVPRVNGVSRYDIIVPIDGEQYRIKQVQAINDVVPRCLDLSLEKVVVAYDIKGD